VFLGTARSEVYARSLHDALPICLKVFANCSSSSRSVISSASARLTWARSWLAGMELTELRLLCFGVPALLRCVDEGDVKCRFDRSEEHTSELQSRFEIVCRLLLE